MKRALSVLWFVLVSGCACSGAPAEIDAASDVDAGSDASLVDAPEDASADAPSPEDASVDGGAEAPDAGVAPTELLRPLPGEVTIIQLDLPTGLIPQLGEAAILVGPDGTLVLLDVGNSGHDDDLRDAIVELNTAWITPARGFPRGRGRLEVDWVVLSHFHSDHIGAMEDLFTGSEPLDLVHGVVHRGFVDIGPGATESDYIALCDLLSGAMAHADVPLCTSASPSVCAVGSDLASPAAACDGLFVGDLADPSDDASRAPTFLDLGGGARLVITGADAWISDGVTAHPLAFGATDSNEENARSLTTLVTHGDFRYHWGGDLTGSGEPGEPDVETHLVRYAGEAFYGTLGVDVAHAHHHARATSSNAAFVDLTAPADGHTRNVVAGLNQAYLRSPYAEVLARWADGARLGTGRVWLTDSAPGGATHASLVVSGAAVIVQTTSDGQGYWVQAATEPPLTEGYTSVR